MLLHLSLLLAGCLCQSFAEVHPIIVPQNAVATLPCPHQGDVSWSRLINGGKVTLVSIKDGREDKTEERFGCLPDNSLVIRNVNSFDSAVYFCNGKQAAYLDVTTDPTMVVPNAGNVPVTQTNHGLGFGLGPGQKGVAAAENQQTSDFWKVPVGVVIGAASVLLAVLTLRFCSKKRAERNNNLDKTAAEVIYEVIEDDEKQPRRDSDVESPYYWTSITESPSTSTAPSNNLYSSVNKLKTTGRSDQECVYFFAQNPE